MSKIVPKTPPAGDSSDERTTTAIPITPRLIVLLGRGSRGKTFFVRWAAECAENTGRAIVIADADRTNATLSAYFSDVVVPPSADDADMHDWLVALCEAQFRQRFTAILDLGGGDLILKRLAHEIGLVDFLERHGIQPVAVHLLGPDRDDLAYLQDVEKDGLFAPRSTILILNESLVPANRSVRAAFEPVLAHSIFRAALNRGAKVVWMPRLAAAHEIDARRLTFAAAEAGGAAEDAVPIGPFNRQLVARWRQVMEKNFSEVADWLP